MTAQTRSRAEETFLARLNILEMLEAHLLRTFGVQVDDELLVVGTYAERLAGAGASPEVIDAYSIAENDLEVARTVMEEDAAYKHLMVEMRESLPGTPRATLQKSVRALVADPETRERAAEASGLYERLGLVA